MDNHVRFVGTFYVGNVVLDDVELLDFNLWISLQFLNPSRTSEHEIVETYNLIDAQLVGLLRKEVHHVITKEARTTCYQDCRTIEFSALLFGKSVECVLDVVL